MNYEEPQWKKLYYKTQVGRSPYGDHDRNLPLFLNMAKEWGFTAESDARWPKALIRVDEEYAGSLVDHPIAFRTHTHGTVFVFSPYMWRRDSDEKEEYERFMKGILKIRPSLIGVYFPKDSYYHPGTFTFVVKSTMKKRKTWWE